MSDYEHVHECVAPFADVGQWELTYEPIVRCKDCAWACEPEDD